MSPENTHKPPIIYMGGFALSINTMLQGLAMRFEVVRLQHGGNSAEGNGIEMRSADHSAQSA